MKVRACGDDSMSFEFRSGDVRYSPTLFNCAIDLILGQALQDYPGVQVVYNIHVPNFAYADGIVILCSRYREMQGHATAISMRINVSKTKVMPALIPGEQRQAVVLDYESLEAVDKFKYLGLMIIANGQGTEEIRSRILLARSPFSRFQSCIWSFR